MSKYAAIASLMTASVFVSHASAQAYRSVDEDPAGELKNVKKTAS